jgi:Na+/H+-dicarboxylate symporter
MDSVIRLVRALAVGAIVLVVFFAVLLGVALLLVSGWPLFPA